VCADLGARIAKLPGIEFTNTYIHEGATLNYAQSTSA
jgi:hypothetical protein